MLAPRVSLLNQEEKDRIHGKSLELLQKVGIQFGSSKAIEALEEAGCQVDWDNLSAKFPQKLVEQALSSLPSQFMLAGRNPENDIICGDGSVYYTVPGQCPWIRDLETRKRRPATSEDLIKSAYLVEAMGTIEQWCALVLPSDVPPGLRKLKSLHISLRYTMRNMLSGWEQIETLPYFFESIDAVLGDRNRLRERPIFHAVINPSSPLTNGGTLVDIMLEFAPYQIPIFMQFLPLAGATAPVTLAGTVLQDNAAFLGNMTLYQLVEPGWPILWAAATGVMDMTTGRYVGGPESILMTLALVEMAKYYGVPSNNFGSSSSEGFNIGFQNGMECMLGFLMARLAEVDNIWWPGDLDGMNLVDLPTLVTANEAVRQVNRLHQGLDIDEEHFLFEVIEKMRFRGEYLGDPSTKKFFRQEHLLPDLFPRESYEAWETRGQSDEEMAISRTKELLASYEHEPLPDEVDKELDRIMNSARKALAE